MKKSFTAIKHTTASFLAFALAASTSIAAFATSTNDGSNPTNIPIIGSYNADTTPYNADTTPYVVSVDIKWESMEFTYSDGNKGTWDPTTHTYTGSTQGSWSWNNQTETQNAPAITVINHSNTGVNVAFSFNSSVEGLAGSFRKYDEAANNFIDLPNNTLTLVSAEGTSFENAPQEKTYFSVDGAGITTTNTELGNITVTVTTGEITQ